MADAFGLVVNIFTLLEFGRKFAILALEIHKEDALPRATRITLVSEDLGKITDGLGQPGSSPVSQDQLNVAIYQLATRCAKVAAQMQEAISGLGMSGVNHKAGSAIVKAFKYKWKESEIAAFQSEIEDLRSELMLNLVLWLRTGMQESLENQRQLIEEFQKSRSHDQDLKVGGFEQERFVQRILAILKSLSANATSGIRSGDYDQPYTSLEMDLMHTAQNSLPTMGEEDASRLQMPPSQLARVRAQFFNLFRYDSMFDREAGVPEAHQDTLNWIFKGSGDETHTWGNFSHWLESQDRLYWITGKMGSGKSTLMKYISEKLPVGTSSVAGIERRCTPHLLRWAQDRPLFIATFYFWAGSSEETGIQTSVEGLYRTLLIQILQAYPESAPYMSPQRWENLCLFNKNSKPPAVKELKIMLSKAIEYVSSIAKVCLFIDGLDESEGETRDLKGLIAWAKKLVETSPVKLCVASRPWRVFEDALQDQPHLLMEDFNFKDIKEYVSSRFHDDPNFKAKKQMETDFCNQLLDEIVTKAEGVFLWVDLVCTSLLESMSRGDLVGDLIRILRKLPVEMEKLYGHILDNLDLKDHAAKYFLLLQTYLGRPDALIFSFADDIGDNDEFSLKMLRESLSNPKLQYRFSELRKRLNSRCRGILTLSMEALDSKETTAQSDEGTIQYCHRSAKDYLTMDTIPRKLIGMLESPFDPHLRLCSAHLARWKCCTHNDLKSKQDLVYKCVEYAAKTATENKDMMIRILDDLDPDFDAHYYIDQGCFGRYPSFGGKLLSLTVALGVQEYVRAKVGQGKLKGCVVRSSSVCLAVNADALPKVYDRPWTTDQTYITENPMKIQLNEIGRWGKHFMANRDEMVKWPLLLDALLSTNQPNPEMVSLLLENGADPDFIIRCADWKESAFNVALYFLRGGFQSVEDPVEASGAKEAWSSSLRVLLQHGAKPDRSNKRFLKGFFPKVRRRGHHFHFISKVWNHFA